jgi:GTPase SAR1 family protein
MKLSKEIVLGYAPRVPIIVVGTKLDLRNDPSTLYQLAEKNQRPITQSQGEYLAHVCSAKVYLECSSMLNFNVRNVFEQAIDIHNCYEERYRHGLSNGRRILSAKLHSCSWFGTLFCCTTGSHRKNNTHERYTV